MRKLVYLVAISLDGFIADADGGTNAFTAQPETLAAIFAEYPETCPTHLREGLKVTSGARHFDTVLMGARTHQPAVDAGLSSAYPHLDQHVITHRQDFPPDPAVTFHEGDPRAVVHSLKNSPGLNMWLCGGGELASQIWDEIDELHLKINPVLLGAGIPFAGRRHSVGDFSLTSLRALPGGVVLAVYARCHRLGLASGTPDDFHTHGDELGQI